MCRPGWGRAVWCVVALALTGALADASVPCDQWQLLNPLPVEQDLLGATHGNDLFVVVGRAGTVLVSPDETAWRVVEVATSRDLRAAVWTGARFVVVGTAATVLTSDDGAEWTEREAPTGVSLSAVAVGPRLIAVGDRGVILSSEDGERWNSESSGTDTDLRGVAWTGSEFLAVGDDARVLASVDGSTWSWRELGQASALVCIASSGSSTVVIAEDGSAWTTADGEHWTKARQIPHGTAVAWVGDRYIATGGTGYSAPRYSLDGLSWGYGASTAPGLRLSTVASDGAVTVAAGVGGALAITRDGGQHFKPVNTPTGLDLYGVESRAGTRVAVAGTPFAAHGAILASEDFVNWEIAYDMNVEALYDVAASGTFFVAVGVLNDFWIGGAMILRSPDGRSWGGAVGSVSGPGEWPWEWRSIVWDGGRFVAAGSGGAVAISTDASSWHVVGGSAVTDHTFLGVASDGDRLVAVGTTGVVAVSPDGETLTVVRPGYEDHDLTDVAWGNGTFVAVGSGGRVLTSVDGDHWQLRSSGTTRDFHGVRYTGDEFVAVGSEGRVRTSADGIEWQPVGVAASGTLLDVVNVGSELVAVGENGLVVRSSCLDPGEPPIPSFAWRPTLPEEGVPVRFTDLSVGMPTTWHWEFGDGITADAEDVTHAFAAPGDWPVTLTVENVDGSATAFAAVTVRRFCGAPPPAVVSAPPSAGSGQEYEVRWTETIQPHEFGEYILVESTDPSFAVTEAWGFWAPHSSHTRAHQWAESGSFFYRVQSTNYCPDGSYRSESSNIARVDIDPDVAELGEHVRVIAAAAHGQGLEGTSWVSDVVIHNPHSSAAPVYLFLLPPEGTGQPVGSPRHWVGPGESLALPDAVADLQDPGYGALLAVSDRALLVGSRTYNDSPDGTFGQWIPGVSPRSGGEVRLIQLTQNESFRTNLALANPRPNPVDVDVELRAADGGLLSVRSYALPGLSSLLEVEVLAGAAGGDVDDAFAVVSPATPDADFVALASVVDGRSGDPVAQPALDGKLRSRLVVREDEPVIRDSEWKDLLFAGDVYVAAGTRALAWSRDGVVWERASGLDTSDTFWELEWNGSQILAVGHRWVYSSHDGATWDGAFVGYLSLTSVAWDGSRWVVVGGGGGMYTEIGFSTDGLDWELHRLDDLHLRTIVWAGDRFVGAGGSGIATSADALSWQIVEDVDGGIKKMVWNGHQLIALGPQELYISDDLEQFRIQPLDWEPDDAVWAGDRWVVAASTTVQGVDDAFLVSPDGVAWETVPNPGPYLHAVEGMTWDGAAVMTVDFRKRLSWLVSDRAEVVIPAAAHLRGYGGSRWRSDLELHNPGDRPSACRIELLEREADNSDARHVDLTVAPGSSLRLPDVLATEFAFDGAGALVVEPGDGAILGFSRTFDDAPGGTYGQGVPGVRASDAVYAFESGRLIQLRHSPRLDQGFRTNIGLVSRCREEMEVEVDLHLGTGELLGSTRATLPARGVIQLNNVYQTFADDTVADGFAVLRSLTPTCAFHAYASVVDNRSHDPILVAVEPWTTSH